MGVIHYAIKQRKTLIQQVSMVRVPIYYHT